MCPKLLFQIRYKSDRTIYRLFQIPLLKIVRKQENSHFYLLGFIPIFKINRTNLLQKRYQRKLNTLKTKKVINVGFLVRENCKWSYEDLYKKLKANKRFNPIVLIVDEKHEVVDLKKNVAFFKKYNYCVIKTIRDFYKHNIDILFYEQPWFDFSGSFCPENISKTAITLYVPYGVEPDIYDNIMESCANFYRTVYKSFIFSEQLIPDFKVYNITNIIPIGHPRLDAFNKKTQPVGKIWKSKNKVRIVYAPHHTFKGSLHMWASWEWNGKHILELAKKNQDITEWVFKPHPRFKLALTQLLGSEKKAQKVFDDWAKVSTLYDTGDYFDLFKTADLMISDCCSFKVEWLPTKKPFIQLLSHYEDRQDYGKNTDFYSEAYYKADSIKDIDDFFDMLVRKHKDPNKKARIALADEIPLGASDLVYKYVVEMIEKQSEGAK